MKANHMLVLGVILAACNPSAEKFASKYAEAECEYAVSCLDAEVLEFNNWVAQTVDGVERSAQEMCELDVIPQMLLKNVECGTFDSKTAKQCIKDWEVQACSENGAEIDAPSSCETVYSGCSSE